jgi:site-specific DNA recombinase
MAIAIYARVSTEEQQQRQSIRTQIEFAQRHCELHELVVYRTYSDDGISGTVALAERPEGSQLVRDARLGKFDRVLLFRLDRLGRVTRQILESVADLEKSGVRVVSLTEAFDAGTPAGQLMLTMLSGFAAHEHAVIRERCMAGTLRVAEAGAWLGGVVPFAYRKVGEKRDAHLVISDDPIPGLAMSEAEVIREVFRMASVEHKSCRIIAARLNALNIPCAYVRDDRLTMRGKRLERTAGIWRAGRVRGLLTNKTYMGVHEYGKRSTSGRDIISRQVPALVTEAVWEKAQQTLRDNFTFSPRGARNQYLLRGLIKCGLCGHNYVGVAANRPNGRHESYYKCNMSHTPILYAGHGRCQAKAVRGDLLEAQVWADVETFLRNPEPILAQLHTRLESDAQCSDQIRKQVARLEGLLTQKGTERSRVVGLYRRGRLTDADLDAQMEEIGKEETALETQLAELRGRIAGADSIGANITSAQALLAKLRKRLDAPVSWEMKRRLVEVLVAGIKVDTFEECGVKQSRITVSYKFSEPDSALPILLNQSYGSGRVIRIPVQPQTVGDHIRLRRLGLKLLQREAAEQLGVDKASVFNWESNKGTPEVRFMPAILKFLGYCPLPEATTLAEQLVRKRTTLGISQKEAALKLGVDAGTLARWERAERIPTGLFALRATRFVTEADYLQQ